jgi:hypothetical protein
MSNTFAIEKEAWKGTVHTPDSLATVIDKAGPPSTKRTSGNGCAKTSACPGV